MTSQRRYLILTPFGEPDVVAGVLKLRGIEADVALTSSGTVIVRDLPVQEFDDWDISELLGAEESATDADGTPDEVDLDIGVGEHSADDSGEESETNISDDPDAVAATLSKLSKFGVVLMTAELGEDVGLEAGTSGIVNAVRVLNGKRAGDVPAGLILNSVDPVIEKLILGSVNPADLANRVASKDVSKSMMARIFQRRGKRKDVPNGNDAIKWNDDEREDS